MRDPVLGQREADGGGVGGFGLGVVFSVIGLRSAPWAPGREPADRPRPGSHAERSHQASGSPRRLPAVGLVICVPPPSGFPSGPITRKPISPGTTQPSRSRACSRT